MATSQTAAMPTPPPNALPCSAPIIGLGIVFNACSIKANFDASLTRVSGSACICSRIHSKSPPAQNDLPVPVRTTTRTLSSAPRSAAACVSSANITADNALCLVSRFNVNVATPRMSTSIFRVSNKYLLQIRYLYVSYRTSHFGCLFNNGQIKARLITQSLQMRGHLFCRDITRSTGRVRAATQSSD